MTLESSMNFEQVDKSLISSFLALKHLFTDCLKDFKLDHIQLTYIRFTAFTARG